MIETILVTLKSKFGGRQVEPRVPTGRSAVVASEDEMDLVAPVGAPPEGIEPPAPLAVFIEYRDSKGSVSQRRIKCKSFDAGRGTLDAYCFERRAARRFRIDRIATVIDVESGEVLEIATFLEGLGAGGVALKDERLARILTIMVFMMRCDREVHPMEREVIEDVAASFALRFDGDDATVNAALNAAFRLAPDHNDLINALQWIGRHKDGLKMIRLLAPQIERIVVADGKITSEEAHYGGLVLDAMKQISQSALGQST